MFGLRFRFPKKALGTTKDISRGHDVRGAEEGESHPQFSTGVFSDEL